MHRPLLSASVILVASFLVACPGMKKGDASAEGGASATAPSASAAAASTAVVTTAASASAGAAGSPSASPAASAPNVDAKGHACKSWEVAFEGECQQLCYSNNQCKGGNVCNVDVPGRTDKGKVCSPAKCKPGEKHLRENHYTLTCLVPCKTDADCKAPKKCSPVDLFNEDANGEVVHGCTSE